MGRPTSYSTASNWQEIGLHVSCQSDAERATRIPRSLLILRWGNTGEGKNKAGVDENIPPLQESVPKEGHTPSYVVIVADPPRKIWISSELHDDPEDSVEGSVPS